MPTSSVEESDRHSNVIALFADKRLQAPPVDYIEREEILWARIAQLEQRLSAAEDAMSASQAAVRALQEAVVWLQGSSRRDPVPLAVPEDLTSEDALIHDAAIDDHERRSICAVWSYLCARYVPGARPTDPLSDLDVVALEQVWSQAQEAAHRNRPRAEDLFYVWIERFLLDAAVPAAEKNAPGMCVRSHLFVRRLPEGLCEKWPPLPPEEDDYLQCFPFDAICVEWDQLVSASAGTGHVAAS